MFKTPFVILAACVLTALPAAARKSVSDCEAVWKSVTDLMPDMPISKPGRMSVAADGCLLRDVQFASEGPYGPDLRMRSIAFAGTGLERVAEGLPPTSILLDIKGFQMSINTGDPVFSYLLMAQNSRSATDMVIRAHWDEATKTVHVDQFDVDFWGDNSVKWTAIVTGIDLSNRDAILLSAGGAAVTAIDAEIVSNGLFETYLLMPLGNMFLNGGDAVESGQKAPEALVEEYRTTAINGLDQVPESLLPIASRKALQVLLAEMPNPAGKLTLRMTADPGIGSAAVSRAAVFGMPKTVAEAVSYLQGAVFDITYTPSAPE